MFADRQLGGDGDLQGDSAYLQAAASFAADTLDELVPLCELATLDCQKRLRHEAWLKFASQLISILGTTSTLVALNFSKPIIAMISAVATLIASASIAIADFIGAAPGGQRVSVQAIYEALSAAILKARVASRELRLMVEFYAPHMNLAEKTTAANVLAGELKRNGDLMMAVVGKKGRP